MNDQIHGGRSSGKEFERTDLRNIVRQMFESNSRTAFIEWMLGGNKLEIEVIVRKIESEEHGLLFDDARISNPDVKEVVAE